MKTVLKKYYRLLQLIVTVLMGLIIIPVTLQIISRYIGIIPRYIWTEEAARFCFMWIILIGAMIAVRDGTHFEVDVLPAPKSVVREAIMRLVVYFFMLIMALVFVKYGYDYAAYGYTQTSELTGINMVVMHVSYLIAGVTWILFLGESIMTAVSVLRGNHAAMERLRGDHHVAR